MNIVHLALLMWLGFNITLLVLFGAAILRILLEPALAQGRLRLARVRVLRS